MKLNETETSQNGVFPLLLIQKEINLTCVTGNI